MQKTLAYLAIVLVFILGAFLGFWLRGLRPAPVVPPVVHTDTLWKHDTVRFPVPVPEKKWIHDTTYIAVTDTIHRNDTTYIPVPRETTYYADSLYEAWVTGFQAQMDSIHIFQKTAIVEVPVETIIRKRWGIGVQAGVTYFPQVGVSPYVGLGVSYNLLTF